MFTWHTQIQIYINGASICVEFVTCRWIIKFVVFDPSFSI